MSRRRSPAPRPVPAPAEASRPKSRKPSAGRVDPPERPVARADLPVLISRFTATLTHPIEQAIAPHAIDALAKFGAIHRRPARTVTFAWIDLDALLALTPVEDDETGESAGLAATYFAVLAAFYRWRAADGAIEPAVAERLASKLRGFSLAMREIERRGQSGSPPS